MSSIRAYRGAESNNDVVHHWSYDYAQPATGEPTMLQTSATDEVDDRIFEYRYDSLDRIDTAWRHPVGSSTHGEDWDYDYDDASNITRRVHDSTTTHFSYTANNQLCWTASTGSGNACDNAPSGADNYSYDPAGNELQGTGDRQSSWLISNQAQNTTVGSNTLSHAFAGPGQAERVSFGALTIDNNLLGIASATGSASPGHYTRSDSGMLLTSRDPSDQSDRRVMLPDALGSIRTVLDADGNVIRDQDYDPYGSVIGATSTGSYSPRFAFAGGITDSTTGLYHYGQRLYDPAIGRWTQPDPLTQMATSVRATATPTLHAIPSTMPIPAALASGTTPKNAEREQ